MKSLKIDFSALWTSNVENTGMEYVCSTAQRPVIWNIMLYSLRKVCESILIWGAWKFLNIDFAALRTSNVEKTGMESMCFTAQTRNIKI